MARRGIDAILCLDKEGNERIIKRNIGQISDWSRPIWLSNLAFEDIPDSYNILDVHEFIMSLKNTGKMTCVRVKWFSTNDNIVELDKVYPSYNNITFCFYRNRNALRLVTVPSKTKKEMISAGADNNGEYLFPLMLSVVNNRYMSLNLF